MKLLIDDNITPLQSNRQQKATITSFSPYLNYDPRLLQQSQPEFIFPEGASKNRGRFEFAFSEIGSAVIVSLIENFIGIITFFSKVPQF